MDNSETTQAIVASGLVKRYEDLVAVNGLNLEVRQGECFGLLGPNGAGKTTSVEIFEGLTKADEGEVTVLGRRWNFSNEHWLRQKVGVALQETRLPEKLTVRETLRLFRSFFEDGAGPEEVISQVGLSEKANSRVGKLSGGQQQRLALGCALIGNPSVLFLDEPTTGLDPQARLHVWEIVESARARGCTILLTTHYMEEAARLCSRVAIMDQGKVIALGSPANLVADLHADQVVEFSVQGTLDAQPVRDLPGVTNLRTREEIFSLASQSIALTLPALFSLLKEKNLSLLKLSTHQASLEDVFVSLTGRGLRDE